MVISGTSLLRSRKMERAVFKKKSQKVWQKGIPRKELPIESLFSQMSELARNRRIRFS
jgi:hypothetical protein